MCSDTPYRARLEQEGYAGEFPDFFPPELERGLVISQEDHLSPSVSLQDDKKEDSRGEETTHSTSVG